MVCDVMCTYYVHKADSLEMYQVSSVHLGLMQVSSEPTYIHFFVMSFWPSIHGTIIYDLYVRDECDFLVRPVGVVASRLQMVEII